MSTPTSDGPNEDAATSGGNDLADEKRVGVNSSGNGTLPGAKISRAVFLRTLAGCTVAAVSGKLLFDSLNSSPKFTCQILGPSMRVGHQVRDYVSKPSPLPVSEAQEKTKVTIIGGGIAGLSAAWWLKKNGFNDFVILELEKNVGGNSSSGKNEISAYPWGAHYVPLANAESEYVRMFFEELGIIQNFDKNGLPFYNDLYMCHDPEERLFLNGSFQEGLVPHHGLQPDEKVEMKRFFDIIAKYRDLIGKDGKRAFAIPVDLSSQDPELIALDEISMAEWLKQNNFKCKPLMWYVNYCCRDDYGGTPDNVSAWAGIHYYSGRNGKAANADLNSVVTWPAGNGFLVEKLREKLNAHIKTKSAVINIASVEQEALETTYFDTEGTANRPMRIGSQYVICATPRFLAKHVVAELRTSGKFNDLDYAPWLVANITLRHVPEGKGVGLAWDNVSYSSKSLGYVVATHQNITTRRNAPTVITYYYPLTESAPAEERQALVNLSAEESSERIIADLEKMHPGIKNDVMSIDLWPWGHGMIRPNVGFIWGETRKRMKENTGNIYFAHSDMSGISNFEEAQYHGVEAAKQILVKLGVA